MQIWGFKFLSDLKKARKDSKNMQYLKHGMGDKMKLVALNKLFCKFDMGHLLATYKRAHYRALFFDNEGTLVDETRSRTNNGPDMKILECLKDLAKDLQNVVL